ncbi:hypothetical protein PRIPAC_86500 [Pristionchus pacificus]|uniref:Uncharacterized protein n=1 Tax=Pristionchus pacificus TaxID=54126 RepID=A0A454Y6W7_PRIPA|nr:hypothetical protein PRIPAC_86500 [Pristionchus pacificus]|eukprot:PDM69041.1 hypothetical protein PRIPAC_47343 [Pristionchus pacificus]
MFGNAECFPRCDFQLAGRRTQATTAISMPCPGQRNMPGIELLINIQLPGGRQRSSFKPKSYLPDYESHFIGSEFSLTNLEVKFYEYNADEFHVNACLTPREAPRVCFMDQIISKRDAYEQACGSIREPGGVSFLFMSALLVFVCLLIGMAATVLIYRLYRRFRERRPMREFQPIISDPHKLSTCSPPRPFHQQLTVVMEEEEDKCSPSTPIKDLFWRSSSPTPCNTPKGTISMQRSSPILSTLLPTKKPTPKPTNV